MLTIVAARSRRLHGLGHDPRRRTVARRDDHQGNVKLGPVKTRSVEEHSGMFAEAFAVVGGDDHPGLFEDGAAVELVDEPAELLVQVRDAIIVAVAKRGSGPRTAAGGTPPAC